MRNKLTILVLAFCATFTAGLRIPRDAETVTASQTSDLPAPTDLTYEFLEMDLGIITYTLRWKFDEKNPQMKNLKSTKVLICVDQKCETYPVDMSKSGPMARFPIVKVGEKFYAAVSFVYVIESKSVTVDSEKIEGLSGEPGPVEDLHVTQTPDKMELDISWSDSSGPTFTTPDKYQVKIEDDTGKTINTEEVLQRKFLYTLPDESTASKYVVTVTAKVNGLRRVIEGKAVSESIEVNNPGGGFPLWAIILIVLAVVAVIGGAVAFFFVKMRR